MSEGSSGLEKLPKPGHLAISWHRLVRANAESIRQGFNRNLRHLNRLRKEWDYLVSEAFWHTSPSVPPLNSVRLIVLLPRNLSTMMAAAKSLVPVALDVTHDTWLEIVDKNPAKELG
jgi:hypothetical protein